MNSKRIALASVLAITIAGVVSYGFFRLKGQQAQNCAVTKVVAATKPLSAGSPITPDSVALIDWPASTPLTGAYTKPADIIGRSVIYPINEHQPILDHDVASAGSGIGLTVKIPEGMRAVSVRSNDVVGVAGFLYPGSHVDVLVTMKKENTSSDQLTQTILPNVEVLTAGQSIEPDPKGKPETVNVVTLLLKPVDGEKLVLASTQGVIQFVLRNGADQNAPATNPVETADLMAGVRKPEVITKKIVVKAPPPAARPVVFHEVETISGDKKSIDKFE